MTTLKSAFCWISACILLSWICKPWDNCHCIYWLVNATRGVHERHSNFGLPGHGVIISSTKKHVYITSTVDLYITVAGSFTISRQRATIIAHTFFRRWYIALRYTVRKYERSKHPGLSGTARACILFSGTSFSSYLDGDRARCIPICCDHGFVQSGLNMATGIEPEGEISTWVQKEMMVPRSAYIARNALT